MKKIPFKFVTDIKPLNDEKGLSKEKLKEYIDNRIRLNRKICAKYRIDGNRLMTMPNKEKKQLIEAKLCEQFAKAIQKNFNKYVECRVEKDYTGEEWTGEIVIALNDEGWLDI